MPCRPADDATPRGYTPNELARLLRVSPDRVRAWIARGELEAVNIAAPGSRPRWVILPDQLDAFRQGRRPTPPPRPVTRLKRTAQVDYYP
jgi:excisionase family DNA binding protein